MRHGQLREIRLRDFRCFGEPQTARLAPLTLLVGENSTGKTSFLAAVQAVWDAARGSRSPDFRKAPFDLGSFPEIVHSHGGRGSVADSFSIGFQELATDGRPLDFDATFQSRDAAPAPVTTSWRSKAASVECRLARGEKSRVIFESSRGSWHEPVPDNHRMLQEPWLTGIFSRVHHAAANDAPLGLVDYWESSPEGSARLPNSEDLSEFSLLSFLFGRAPSQDIPFASAPIHAIPRRTYDPARVDADPWGADVPSRFASLQFRHKAKWAVLKKKLDEFGRESGTLRRLLREAAHRSRGRTVPASGAKIRQEGEKGTQAKSGGRGIRGQPDTAGARGPVSHRRTAPCFFSNSPSCICTRAPRPALGSLFCRTAEAGRQLIVETHSDYIMNRIRLDIRDRRTNLMPEDVMLLYFERHDLDVRIHPIRFDGGGNVQDAPPNYRRFFADELNRSLDY